MTVKSKSRSNLYKTKKNYSSTQITSLKIKYNPFAKAFLDAKERSEHQQQISTSSLQPSHPHYLHHHHRFAEYPPSCHITPLPLSPSSLQCRCCVGGVGGYSFHPHHRHALSSPPSEYRSYSTSFPYLSYEHLHEAMNTKTTYVGSGRHYPPPPSAIYSPPPNLCKSYLVYIPGLINSLCLIPKAFSLIIRTFS